MKVRDARAAIEEQESEKVLQSDVVTREAVRAAEQVRIGVQVWIKVGTQFFYKIVYSGSE